MAHKSPQRLSAPAQVREQRWHPIVWFVLAGLVIFLLSSLVSFDPADPPSHAVAPVNETVSNWCGRVGAFVAYHVYYRVGHGIWLGIGALLAYLIATAAGKSITHPAVRAMGVLLILLAVSALESLWFPTWGYFPEGSGGVYAIAGVGVLAERFSGFGTALILLTAVGVGAVVAADEIVVGLPVLALRAVGLVRQVPVRRVVRGTLGRLRRRAFAESDEHGAWPPSRRRRIRIGGVTADADSAREGIDPDAGGIGGTRSFDPDDEASAPDDADDAKSARTSKSSGGKAGEVDMDALREKIKRLPVNMASAKNRAAASAQDTGPRGESSCSEDEANESYEGYQFPPMDLLAEPEANYSKQMESFVRGQAEALEHALQTYRIDGEVVGIDSGPVITLYEVQLVPGTKVAAITSIQSDIARALRAPNIRIVPNMAGKTTVGVEVPNLNKERVRLKELMNHPAALKMKLPMFLAKDASGTPLVADLTAMPHMLIAGTTGSGKSVCINTIIMSFLYTKRPDELKLILVDPKMVELSQFKSIPHLMCPVVTETDRATAILEWAVTKMAERYELLAEAGVRDIARYNKLGWEELEERFKPASEAEAAKIPRQLPYIVFVIDELADLIMTNKDVETAIVRVAQKARAVGIHLILATQRPQANVVTGLIKSNMPCRISFKVSSGMDSRIVLDSKGAELLLGQGDMLFLGPRTSELIRAQGTLISDNEIRKVTRFLRDVASPSYERQLMTIRTATTGEHDEEGLAERDRDPLFFDAVEIVVETGRGSVSLLQRRLAIGYTRASRLIDQMGLAGIIGEHKGSQARAVLTTPEEWQHMRKIMETEEAEGTLFGSSTGEESEVPRTTGGGEGSSGTDLDPQQDNGDLLDAPDSDDEDQAGAEYEDDDGDDGDELEEAPFETTTGTA